MEAWRLLADDGTLYLHLDYREVHYAKVMLDAIFGRECFLNEIIWAYDYGARAKYRWPTKHDNILVYVKNPAKYHFDSAEVDREPYMAPGLVTPAKRELGQAAHRRLVAHHRLPHRPGENRLPDAEARGADPPRWWRASSRPGRLGAGLLRRLRHAGRRGREAGPASSSAWTRTRRPSTSWPNAWAIMPRSSKPATRPSIPARQPSSEPAGRRRCRPPDVLPGGRPAPCGTPKQTSRTAGPGNQCTNWSRAAAWFGKGSASGG